MFPDFPEIKAHVMRELMAWFQEKIQEAEPLLGDVSRYVQHEGIETGVVRADGTVDRVNLEEHGTGITIDHDMLKGDVASIMGKFEEAAKQLASAQMRMLVDKVTRAAEEVGNVVDADGQAPSWQHHLQMLEKMSLDFDPITEEPILPTLLVHPSKVKQLQQTYKESESDPQINETMSRIVQQKREEWRARESSRKLVD